VKLFHHAHVSPLFAGLFDDAALFPPGNAAMDEAVRAHGESARAWYSDLVGPFICPSNRLNELDAAAQHIRFGEVNIALTVPGGLVDVKAARDAAAEYGWVHLKAMELPLGDTALDGALATLQPLTDHGTRVFLELPLAQVTPAVSSAAKSAGIALNFRTGGMAAEAFPTVADLASGLSAACGSGVQFKCTAGLHHAVRHTDPQTGFTHHGFLNILLAIHVLQSSSGDAVDVLSSTDSAALAEQIGTLSDEDARRIREQFSSIGPCSISEPLDDLLALGLVVAP
jgi:hypothetical protein